MELRVRHITSYARAPSSLLFLRSARYPQMPRFFCLVFLQFSEPLEGGLDIVINRQAFFAKFLTNAPPPHEPLRTCFVCATQAHAHFCPQHWLLCHLGLYKFEFEFQGANEPEAWRRPGRSHQNLPTQMRIPTDNNAYSPLYSLQSTVLALIAEVSR